jgi:predicted metalloprotease
LVRACLLVVLAALLCGCTAVVAGHPTPAPPAGSVPVSPAPESTAVPEPCGASGAPDAVARCLAAEVTHFWSTVLSRPLTEPMVVDPPRGTVPGGCRAILSLGTAFYCTDNHTVYLTAALIVRSRAAYGPDLPYALAAVIGHEFGHVVQDTVHQPGFDASDLASSRRIEQQADCLLGVWAHDAGRRNLLDPAHLVDLTRREYTTVEKLPPPPDLHGYNERATHGTVAERIAALSQGLSAGTPTSCGLATPGS